MSDHLTPKQERFCQKYIELGNASEAYRQTYDAVRMKPESVNRKAKELLDNGKIAARIGALLDKHCKRHCVTVDSLTSEYDEVRIMALGDKQYSPAVAAITGKAKLHGLVIEKNEHTGKDGGPIVTKEQRDAAVSAALDADS